ncbi:MAG TPA: mechanosensitive ion channel domain-containing protein, partial [Telluria sp.]
KPFEVGDSIAVSGFSGTVEHVGLKTTRIRADSGEQIVISNAELLKNTVRNYKRMLNRRIAFALRVCPETPPALAARVPAALKAIIESKDRIRFDRAHLKVLDQNFIEFEMVYFVLDPSYALFMDTQQQILLEAMQMFEDLGISTAARPRQLLLQEAAANDREADTATPALLPGAVRSLQQGT